MKNKKNKTEAEFFSNHTKYKHVILTVYSLLQEMKGWSGCN